MEKIKKIPNNKLIEVYTLAQTVKYWEHVKIEIYAGNRRGFEVCLAGYNCSENKIVNNFFDCYHSIDEVIEALKKLQ